MTKPVIICVDDEPTILDSLEIQLRKSFGNDYLIETAVDGEEALELVEELLADSYEVALVIADCIMPKMQGDELLRRIHIIAPKTIKIMLTGQANLESVGNAINQANLYRYITKPWQDEDLRLTIQEAVRSYFQEKQLAEQNLKLAAYNQNLERLVKSRTQELEEKNLQLIASEKKYRALVEASQDMIWSVDVEGRYTFVNQAVKQIYGYEPHEMLDRLFADFEPPEKIAKDLELFQRLLNEESIFQYEIRQLAKDGRLLYLMVNAIPLRDDQGNIIGTTGTASDITKRKQTEEALYKSEFMLRQILNTMPGAVYQFMLSPQGEKKYCFMSQGAYKLLGYTAEQLIEDYALQWNQILPEDRDRMEESIKASAKQHQPWFEEFRIHHTNGQVRWIQGYSLPGEPLPDGTVTWTGTLTDVTDRKQREEALQLIVEGTASETGNEFFRSCVRYLAQLLHVRYALVTEWSDQAKTRLRTLAYWTGNDFSENFEYPIAGNPCHEVLHGTTCYYPEHVQALFPNNADLVRLGVESYFGIPLTNASGKILGHLAVMDIKPMITAPDGRGIPSERLHILKIFAARAGAELERKLTEDALKQSAYAADAANRAKSEFLSRMSHELRTPLNAILGFTQVMNRSPSRSTEEQEHLGIISRSGEHLLELINDILAMSKIESGRVTLKETNFDLYNLLDTLKEMFQLKAQSKGIQLIFDRASDVPQYVKTDESKLRQILINLLGNAMKFTEAGKVALRVAMGNGEEIPHSQLRNGNALPFSEEPDVNQRHPIPNSRLYFAVEDTGFGIAPEEMHLLFAPFEQTETGRKSQQGTGLGLPLTRQFVQLMGGDVSVSSTVGKGTIVKFDVPLCLAQSQEVQTPQKPRRVIGLSPDQLNYRILVVDDVKVSRLLLVKLLTSTGFEVREAKDGLEAIALWESWKPHLILMDVQMPEMDGCEATRQIKSREKERGRGKDGENRQSPIPNPQSQTIIIALTANAFEEDRAVVLAAGCDDFISKPFQEETIFGKIAKYLGVRYIYEEPARKSSEIEPQDGKNLSDRPLEDYLSKMPAEWVKQLYQEAITGSDCQIFNLIEQIPSNHAPLRHALMDWVKDFDFERVIDLIKQVSNEGKEN